MERIALSGPLFSGKTTLAHALRNEGYFYINFTDLLKQTAVTALRAAGVHTTVAGMHQNKKLYRGFLQEFGTVLDFDRDPKWVLRALEQWIEQGEPKAVFDNVRTLEQLLTLRDYDFELVELRISQQEQYRRGMALGVYPQEIEKALAHPIEAGIVHPELVSMYLSSTESTETNIRFLLGEQPSNQSSIGRETSDIRNETEVSQPILDTAKRIAITEQ